MKLKKLFQVLVLGGAAIGAVKCGPDSPNNGQNQNPLTNDGGTSGGNPDGGGVHFW
jgi:hypothetical protein